MNRVRRKEKGWREKRNKAEIQTQSSYQGGREREESNRREPAQKNTIPARNQCKSMHAGIESSYQRENGFSSPDTRP